MAAKRGKNQARRSGGGSGGGGAMPGWVWLVVGAVIALAVVFASQRFRHGDKDGFFRPTPNPDAQPKAASDDAVVDDETVDDKAAAKAVTAPPSDAKKKQDYDFYTLLPGKEVPMTDAELAASEQAEKAQQEKPKDTASATPAPAATQASPTVDAKPLPAPVDESAASADARPTPAATPKDAAPKDTTDTRYVLQAGAFQASGQAEELKAKIALLGLGARVESAQIGGKTVYRVRMGPYSTASELADAKRKLASGGLSAMAVKTN